MIIGYHIQMMSYMYCIIMDYTIVSIYIIYIYIYIYIIIGYYLFTCLTIISDLNLFACALAGKLDLS